jgi:hypothetical protein
MVYMSSSFLRLFLCVVVMACFEGCGGGSNGGSGGGGGGGGQPTTVTVTFAGGTPTAVATQIGSGSFAAVSPSSTITLTLPNGTTDFAVAYVCQVPTGYDAYQVVQEATTADGTSFTWPCPSFVLAGQTDTLSFDLDYSAIPNVFALQIDAQNGDYFSSLAGDVNPGSFLAPVGSDSVEILAYSASSTLLAAKLLTNQTVPGALDGGSTVVLGAADETTLQPITLGDAQGGAIQPEPLVSYYPAGAAYSIDLGISSDGNTLGYPVLPASVTPNGGTYVAQAFAGYSYAGNSGTGPNLVWAGASSSSGGPLSLVFPAPWPPFTPTPAPLPTLNTAYSGFAGESGVSQTGSLTVTECSSPTICSGSSYQVTATRNYQNGATSLTFPNLSTIPGFLASPTSGATICWTVSVEQGIIPGGPLGLSTPGADTSNYAVSNAGCYNVP